MAAIPPTLYKTPFATLAKTLPENGPHLYKTLYGTITAHVSLVIGTAFITFENKSVRRAVAW